MGQMIWELPWETIAGRLGAGPGFESHGLRGSDLHESSVAVPMQRGLVSLGFQGPVCGLHFRSVAGRL